LFSYIIEKRREYGMEIYEIEDGKKIFSWCPGADKEVAENADNKTAYEQMEIIAKLPYVQYSHDLGPE